MNDARATRKSPAWKAPTSCALGRGHSRWPIDRGHAPQRPALFLNRPRHDHPGARRIRTANPVVVVTDDLDGRRDAGYRQRPFGGRDPDGHREPGKRQGPNSQHRPSCREASHLRVSCCSHVHGHEHGRWGPLATLRRKLIGSRPDQVPSPAPAPTVGTAAAGIVALVYPVCPVRASPILRTL